MKLKYETVVTLSNLFNVGNKEKLLKNAREVLLNNNNEVLHCSPYIFGDDYVMEIGVRKCKTRFFVEVFCSKRSISYSVTLEFSNGDWQMLGVQNKSKYIPSDFVEIAILFLNAYITLTYLKENYSECFKAESKMIKGAYLRRDKIKELESICRPKDSFKVV